MGWGVSESQCEEDETTTYALSRPLDKENDVAYGNGKTHVSSEEKGRCMFETLAAGPLHIVVEGIDDENSAVDEDGQRDEGMRGILHGPVENGIENPVSVDTPCNE